MSEMKKQRFYKMPFYYDKLLHFALIALALFGLLMSTSASMGTDAADYFGLIFTVIKQLLFLIAGYISIIILSKIFTFELVKQHISTLILATLFFLCFALVFRASGGARAWIRIPIAGYDITIQPSEFAKISIMLIMASFLGDIKKQDISFKAAVRNPFIYIGIFIFIVAFLQKDMGTALIMAFISVVCFLIPKHKVFTNTQFGLLGFALLGIGLILVFIVTPIGSFILSLLPTYQAQRFTSALNPFADKYNSGFQLIKGLISFASGGITGVGFGNSIQKYTNFPAASTDYILAIIVEELGIIGFLIVLILYSVILYKLFKYAKLINNEKAKMFLIGTAMYLIIHFVLNVGGVTGFIPLTGVPLLLLSSGGSSTLAFMMCIGICQALIIQYKTGKIE